MDKRVFYGLCAAFVLLSCFLPSSPEPVDLMTKPAHPSCSHVGLYDDQCAFVKKACQGYSRYYLEFYYCSDVWQPLSIFLLCSGLFLLFGAVSVAASDFFCPNLQTISTKLQLSESMAGVTILAFGNGSSDLFSTFSAMNSGSGSLAIGELIGAAFFIVSVVSGSMGIIRPFRSKRITFMRDASFLTGAICMITWIVYHRRIYWYHGLGLIAYYITYVVLVVAGTYYFPDNDTAMAPPPPPPPLEHKSMPLDTDDDDLLDEAAPLLDVDPKQAVPEQPSSSRATSVHHLGHVIRPVSIRSASQQSVISSMRFGSSIYGTHTSASGSIASRYSRMPLAPRVGIRTSLFSAIEFQEQVSSIRRANSTQVILPTTNSSHASFQGWPRAADYSAPTLLPPPALPPSSLSSGQANSASTTANGAQLHHLVVPASNHTTQTPRDDYFSYISAHQSSMAQQPQPQASLSPPEPQKASTTGFPPAPAIVVAPVADEEVEKDTKDALLETPLPPLPAAHGPHGGGGGSSSSHVLSPALSFSADPLKHSSYGVSIGPLSVPLDTYLWWEDVMLTLFPPMHGWATKTTFAKLSSLVALPLVFVFTLTLPVVESDDIRIDDMEVLPPTEELMADLPDDHHLHHQNAHLSTYMATATTTAHPNSAGPSHHSSLGVPDHTLNNNNHHNATRSSPTHTHTTNSPRHASPIMHQPQHDPMVAIDTSFLLDDPLMDEEMLQNEWCQWLVIVQAVCSCSFAFLVMVLNGFLSVNFLPVGVFIGCVLGFVVFLTTNEKQQPSWYWLLSFVGFAIALNWIFLLANLMVGMLQALGAIFSISEAIMGLTIFAVGSSIGDLVANTAIAKMGFPTMAISACYAGPLLNMVLGVGISSAYQTLSTGQPYKLDIAPTILVSSGGLIVVLLSTLIVVNLNGYYMNKELGWWMISVYIVCCLFDVLLEMDLL
ncbi:Sodium/calcium exchanger protein-domain-containing protein [Gongronella butleri]|nr:Sodium/calcium exchanger protein-domain-containing protein [Gongronella butleri]